MAISSNILRLLFVIYLTTSFVQAGLLYQISLNGRGKSVSQKKIERIRKQAYRKTRNVIEQCYGASYMYIPPGDAVDVEPTSTRNLKKGEDSELTVDQSEREVARQGDLEVVAGQAERELTTIKLCPKKCRRKRNYDWCYLLGCLCRACGGRRVLKAPPRQSKCDERLNRAVDFIQRKYDVELEVFFFKVN